jgi:hypothetical protein
MTTRLMTARRLTLRMLLVAGMVAATAHGALAQMRWTDRGFVNVNVAGQTGSHDIEVSTTFDLYNETAAVAAAQKVGSGPLFDMSAGVRVWRNLAVAIGFSTFGDKADGAVAASIPDPLVGGQFASVSGSASGLKHSERGVHFQAVWMMPITDKIDVAFSGGPSIFSVSQDLISGVTIAPGTQTMTGVVTERQKKTGAGGNVGVDVTYIVRKGFGGGVFMRYAGGSVDLPLVQNLGVGGFQMGIGGRYRF